MFFTIVAVGLVIVGTTLLDSTRRKTLTSFRLNSQANQFARAGLTEATSWFRRQAAQPVTEFAPRIDNSVEPPLLDTDEPELGLVREFPIEGKIWGRYEVWKAWDQDPDPARRAWRTEAAARDVSAMRSMPGAGLVWRLRSVGIVFVREDPTARFDERPNRVEAKQLLEIEIMRRRIAPPGQAALTVGDGNSAHINTWGRIVGGADGAGIFYPAGTGTPTTGPVNANRVTGTPALSPSTEPFDLSTEAVLGLSRSELRATADHVVTDPRDFPVPVPTGQTVFVDIPSISFDAARPLRGNGIVFVQGNVSILPGSGSQFSGLLYIDGNLDMRAPSEIAGAVIVTGNMTLQGTGDYATIRYDDAVLNALRQQIGPYRPIGTFRPVIPD